MQARKHLLPVLGVNLYALSCDKNEYLGEINKHYPVPAE